MRVVRLQVLQLFDAYYRVMDEVQPADWVTDARRAMEARKRLRQLDWMLLQIQRLEVDVAGIDIDDREKVARTRDAADEIELLTEAFYYLAFRASRIMRSLPSVPELGNLSSFNPTGVRDVRNHLIEHPEGKDSRVFDGGFAMGGEQGPVLRAPRVDSDPQHWQDPGLYVNAREFEQDLSRLLAAYLQRDPRYRQS